MDLILGFEGTAWTSFEQPGLLQALILHLELGNVILASRVVFLGLARVIFEHLLHPMSFGSQSGMILDRFWNFGPHFGYQNEYILM